jgi:hypothetical protein
VQFAIGQPPEQEAIYRPKTDFARFSPAPQGSVLFQEMRNLGAGEVGVDDQSGFLAERRFQTLLLQPVADAGTHSALPDDRVRDGLARLAVPQQRCLALIGNA